MSGRLTFTRDTLRPPHYQETRSSTYLIARMQRDAPEVAEDLAKGAYASTAAAAKAARIIYENRRMWIAHDPQKAAEALAKRFPAAFLQAVVTIWQEKGLLRPMSRPNGWTRWSNRQTLSPVSFSQGRK